MILFKRATSIEIYRSVFVLTIFLLSASILIGQNQLNSRLFYVKPPLFRSKSKVTSLDLSLYDVTVALPVDDRNKFYGEIVYKNKKTHALNDFFESPTMVEIQNKIKSDVNGFKSKRKILAQKKLSINTTVEVFYPKLEGFVNRKSFAKVRLVMTAHANDVTVINRKYETLYVTNGTDKEFEGNVFMTIEDGENVTVGMALRKTLDQFYFDLHQVLTLKENWIIMFGKVTSSKTGGGLSSAISFGSDPSYPVNSSSDGHFQIMIPKTKYAIRVIAPDFMTFAEEADLQISDLKMMEMNFKLQPIEKGNVVNLKNVLFQMGTTILLKDSFAELDDVVAFLKKNSRVKIELHGYTDNQGNAEKDLQLSQQRVDKIKNYLVSKGIGSKRITGKGFGPSKPIASNDNEEGRKLNRRVEFVIVKK